MAELANCKRCGDVFVTSFRDICQKCYKEEETAFQTVYRFLKERKNREATIIEIVEATGIEEELIIKFVKEKRLTPKLFPNLAYSCDRCGKDITTGTICSACTEELKQDLFKFEEEERQKIERKEKEKESIYFSLNKHKK